MENTQKHKKTQNTKKKKLIIKSSSSSSISKVLPHVEFLWGFPIRIIEDGKEIGTTKK